ncbi:AAA family ATPase [Sphingobacterium kitahiroshimense]|uniref:AAA family ATPase n=1 Tax=Sphingobacterium kitahiroshimense TaxID=470446 RepID=A0ABV0C0T4_9SPHI
MISKIDIANFGLYKDYSWNQSVGNAETFRKLNIIYGRNYSGKTTLSRIFKCIEDQSMHRHYGDSSFSITLHDGTVVTSQNLNTDYNFRVYNTDFVRENLSWLHNDDGTIKPFTILGAKNVEIERRIEEIIQSLGSVENSQGILYSLSEKQKEVDAAKITYDRKSTDLESKLKKRANDNIKVNPNFFLPTSQKKQYIISDIKTEIELIKNDLPTFVLGETEETRLKAILNDSPLVNIELLKEVKPNFANYYELTKELLQKNIKPSVAIVALLEDHLLQEWVRQGIDKHREKRENCAFCGGAISPDLWKKLDEHFSKESEELREELNRKIQELKTAKIKLTEFLNLRKEQFYSSIQVQYESAYENWQVVVENYEKSLDDLINNLELRQDDIFKIIEVPNVIDYSEDVLGAITEFNRIINLNNDKTSSLAADQNEARTALRQSHIADYLSDINYNSLCKEIEDDFYSYSEEVKLLPPLRSEVDTLLTEKESLEAQAKDESKGAELVNQHLSHFFGHRDLRLVSVDEELGVKFKIQRNGLNATNLSEGESSLISFCYFIARIEDELQDELKHNKLIIYIDDPMSSLDSNHIFFMFSLIEAVIAEQKKYAQLFISTHNLEFLKYLRKLTIPKKSKKEDFLHLLIERKSQDNTIIRLAPDYLNKYITEFNYLFDQIYNCQTAAADDDTISYEYQYNFANNMRKFLEAYLFYKYPNHKLSNNQRIKKYFNNDSVTVTLLNRVTNEFSHLEDKFDRSLNPIDIPEIRQIADLVLGKIRNDEPDQYDALLESIGKEPIGRVNLEVTAQSN